MFTNSYAEAARGLSAVFLLLQILLLVNFAYDIHDFFVAKIGDADPSVSRRYKVGIAFYSLFARSRTPREAVRI